MAIRETIQVWDPVLITRTPMVSSADIGTSRIEKIIADLIDTKEATNLVGMAAPQIGESVRIFVMRALETALPWQPKNPDIVMINPEITIMSDRHDVIWEGCGSFLECDMSVPVRRATEITVRAQNRFGKIFELTLNDLNARIFQHEYDHLNGIIMHDRVAIPYRIVTRDERNDLNAGIMKK